MKLQEIGNSKCMKCPLHEGTKHVCLMGDGNPKADIVFVGEASGSDEDRAGRPFVGASGNLLANILAEYKLTRRQVYVTNSVKCRPPNNRKVHVKELRACSEYLIKEIQAIQPKLVVALGRAAIEALMNEPVVIAANRGRIFNSPVKEISHIPIALTYHPAAVKRDNTLITSVFSDFDFFFRVLEKGAPVRSACVYKKGVAPVKDKVSIDLETHGLNPFVPSKGILAVGTSVHSRTGYCTTEIDSISDIVSNKSVLKIGHNIKFDIKWMWKGGYNFIGPIHDTLVAEHLLDENLPSFGLKEITLVNTDMGAYSAEIDRTLKLVGRDMSKVPIKTVMRYCAQDVDAAYRAYLRQVPKLKAKGLMKLFKLVMAGEMVIARAEFAGVKIDQYRHRTLATEYRKKLRVLKRKIEKLCAGKLKNPNSSLQLGRVLTGHFGLPIVKKTKTGRISVDEAALEQLLPMDESGVVKTIIKFRRYRGDYVKYLTPNKMLWQPDGKVHCWFNISGTDTGRYSCVQPNLQQVPKQEKSPIKELFIPSFKGGRLVNLDYDQGELRILAQESRDSKLIRTFKEGLDIHRATASDLYGVEYDEVTKVQRYAAKVINFGIIYGMGRDKLAAQTKMTEHDAERFLRDYLANYPGVRSYIREKHNQIIERGYVTNLFGRRRTINIVDLDDIREVRRAQRRAVNAPIQGGLHDLNILGMVALYRELRAAGMESKIVLAVHDSITLDCPLHEVEAVKKLAVDVFQNPDTEQFGFKFIIPLTVSIGVGRNWKEASESD